MEIAKNVDASEYLKLKLDCDDLQDWEKAVNILRSRLTERFIEPTDKLIELENSLSPDQRKYGFAILAIDFLLTETLQSFYEGEIDSNSKSVRLFENFLTERQNFKEFFDIEEARNFYKCYRCGILHQAQTNENRKVWSVGDLYHKIGKYTILNRNQYHFLLKLELDLYFNLIKEGEDKQLRTNFIKKMDFIATN